MPTRNPAEDRAHDLMLGRAFLLIRRKRYDAATRILQEARRRFPEDVEVGRLLADIREMRAMEKAEDDRQRAWRFQLGLHTTARRIWWGVGAVLALAVGLYNLVDRVPQGFRRGFATEITTKVYGGRRHHRRLRDYTRPIYYDLLYGAALTLAGGLALVVLARVSRNAAQWEELEPSQDESW